MAHTEPTCDNCARPLPIVMIQVLPINLQTPAPSPWISDAAGIAWLCKACGAQRRDDIRDFLAGYAPTKLMMLEI